MFSNEQIKELQRKLSINGAKDTDFDVAESINLEDTIVIIQNNINKRTTLGSIIRGLNVGIIIE